MKRRYGSSYPNMGSTDQHNSIMADQLAGQWYAHTCGLPPIHETAQMHSALTTIFDCEKR